MRAAVAHLRRADPVLAAIIGRVGAPRIEYREPVFATLVRSIVFQQLHGKAAAAIYARLEAAAGAVTPEAILKLRPARLRAAGLSAGKADYVRDLARRTRDGDVDFPRLASLDDAGVIEHLTRVKGVGVWTAQMFLIFALRRPDVLPVGDYGIRAAMREAYRLPELPKAAEMGRIAAPWRPHASLACWYLWRSLDGKAALQ